MRLERIDSIFDFEKGTLQSTKCDPGEFDFITASREWKTHKEFTHDKEALVIAVAASGSLGRTHYANGKFTASDLCFILTPKEGTAGHVSLPFYQFVFNGLRQDLVKKCATGTAKQAINRQNFASYLLPLFGPDEQERMAEKLKWAFESQEALETEITHQQTLLGKLKQAILQEAIQGKLTADWRAANPDVEPASELLQRIEAEKARLIDEKKIRKEKPLPEITPEEIPFDVPEGWEWCRWGELNLDYSGGATYKSNEVRESGDNQVIRIGNIKPDRIDLTKRPAFLSEELANETANNEIFRGDFLFTMTGTYEKRDYCFSVLIEEKHFQGKRLFQNQRVGRFRTHGDLNRAFLIKAIKLDCLLDPVFASSTGAANQANISKGSLMEILIPLPPLAEQAAIVERVEALMATCRELEAEIERSRNHAADLLQAVLKEAFASEPE